MVENEEEQVFKAIEIKEGVTQNGYSKEVLPTNFELNHAEVVIKGAYDLLSRMNNFEVESMRPSV